MVDTLTGIQAYSWWMEKETKINVVLKSWMTHLLSSWNHPGPVPAPVDMLYNGMSWATEDCIMLSQQDLAYPIHRVVHLKWDYYVFDSMCWAIRGHHSSRVDNVHPSPYKCRSTAFCVLTRLWYALLSYTVCACIVSYSSDTCTCACVCGCHGI